MSNEPARPTKRSGSVKGLVLSYHRIAPAALDPWGLRVPESLFAQQMEALRTIGEPVSLRDLAGGQGASPGRPAIAVTFDDGYIDNLTLALPHLDAHRIPATVFVASGYTGRRQFWWEVVEQVFLTPGTLPRHLSLHHGGQTLSWDTAEAAVYSQAQYAADCRGYQWGGEPGSRIRLYFDVHAALWSLPVETRMDLAEDIRAWAETAASDLEPARPMTFPELAQLADHDLITIGGHSVNHPALDTLSPRAQRAEIAGNRAFLQELTGQVVDTFAYPHGRHVPEILDILGQQGFKAACTTQESAVRPGCNALLLPRVVIKAWDAPEFAARLTDWLVT